MSNPQIDVIIPNFNKGNYLKECLDSVIRQTYKNWCLYIIDDCSNDNSKTILKDYENKKNFNVIKLKKNKGPSFCRNLGIRLSKSEYLSFLDSDDFWTKDKLELQIEFMIKNNLEFTYTDYTSFIIKNNKHIYKNKTNLKESFTFNQFIRNSSINSSTMIISRDMLKTNRFKKVALLEDYLFKCDILKNNKIAKKINNSLAYYRILPSNRSANKLLNIYWLWKINGRYNKLSFFDNIQSIFGIMINSVKKYGFK